MKPILFAGPTLARAHAMRRDLAYDAVQIEGPIRRGDLPALVAARPPGVAIIVDGVFHSALAVGHAEIRNAIAAGWTVIGVASMGAIRACEMHEHGMIGFGEVFERYRSDPDFRDDEVALLHEPAPPFRELSEPLIHLRRWLDHLVAEQVIGSDDRAAAIDDLAGRWFGERTLQHAAALLATPERRARIAASIADIDRHRVKAHDLIRLLEDQRWRKNTK